MNGSLIDDINVVTGSMGVKGTCIFIYIGEVERSVSILPVILPIFGIILFGYVVQRTVKIDLGLLSNLAVYVLLPSLVIYSLSATRFDEGFITVALSAFVVTAALGAIAVLFSHFAGLKRKDGDCLISTSMFMNTAYIGLPICLLAFGNEGLGYAAIYAMVGTILISSFGAYIISGRKSTTAFLELPLFYAAVIGLAISFFSIQVPGPLVWVLELVGKGGVPLGLFLVGAQLTTMKINRRMLLLPALNGAIKILIAPLLALLLCLVLGITGAMAGAIIIQSSMPSAVLNSVLSLKYKNNPDTYASVVFFSTLLSVLSISVILLFLV